MLAAVIMIGVGLLLIVLEFFLPGGIMGIAGGVVFLLGLVAFAINSPSIILTVVVIGVSLALLILLIRLTLKRLQQTKSEASIYLKGDQAGYKASAFSQELIGKEGIVRTDLKPAGHVTIEGKPYQALSRGAYLTKGTSVIVVGGQGAHLIVKEQSP